MNIVPIIKGAAGLVSSLGAGAVVGNAIKATTPVDMTKTTKILVGIGGVVLSSVSGEAAAKYVEQQVQDIADSIATFRGKGKGPVGEAAAEAAAANKRFAETVVDEAKDTLKETFDDETPSY